MEQTKSILTPGTDTSEYKVLKRAILVIIAFAAGVAVLIGALPADRVDPILKAVGMGVDGLTSIMVIAGMVNGYSDNRAALKSKEIEYLTEIVKKELEKGDDPQTQVNATNAVVVNADGQTPAVSGDSQNPFPVETGVSDPSAI